MPQRRQIAAVMELQWPYRRHYEIFSGIREYAEKNCDWEFHLGNFPEVDLAGGVKFDAVIGRITSDCFSAIELAKIPVVNVWVDSPVATLMPSVQVDLRAAGQISAEHLFLRGVKRLIHVGFEGSLASKRHFLGVKEVADRNHLECVSCLVRADFEVSKRSWAEFVSITNRINEEWQPPVGMIFTSDELAHATTNRLNEFGWRVPEDLAVVGSSNELLICNATKPSLSSVDLSHRRCGYEAAALLDQLLSGADPPDGPILVPPKELVLRGSSDAYAVDDPVLITALRFIANNLHEKISVPEIARQAGVGRQVLERRFRKSLKRSVNEEVTRLRVSKMKRLLVESDQTIAEVSHLVGFGTAANMNVMFKRSTGQTPQAYRERYAPKQREG